MSSRYSKCLVAGAVALALVVNANATGTDPAADASRRTYPAPQGEGLIGINDQVPFDNPADNIFHVDVPDELCDGEAVWLVYELDGVQDHTAVSRSINDQVAVGGYLVRERSGWALQRERIKAEWLTKGDNIIRFTLPEHARHSYRVRNVRIEVENTVDIAEEGIILNQPSPDYFISKAYIKGLIPSGVTRVMVDGKEARAYEGEFESIIDFASGSELCTVDVEAHYADGTTKCTTVSFGEAHPADFVYAMEPFTFRKETLFQARAEVTVSLHGASLTTADSSLSNAALLSITTLRPVDLPPLDAGMENVTARHAGFRFLPNGIMFGKAAILRIPYDPEKIPDGYTEKDIRTYYFDERAHHWVPVDLDTVLAESSEVVSKTVHFTDYINGIIKVPESPEVEAYNSTSMKGIKAANPTAAVNLIQPPQANNTGSASVGFPINIPAGRGGMQPQLGINYNSGGGNGWLGLGWNLMIPSIGIDTRWGVPRYDPAKETETYAMNGEMLTPVAHRGELQDRYPSGKRFFPRVEGSFSRIVRNGDSPSAYWWEITDKSGTKYFYGATSTGFDEQSVLRTDEANDDGNIAQWMLSEVRDLNGNTVRYYYDKVSDESTVPGYQIYISRITYTGTPGVDGKYEVLFKRDRQLSESLRADVSVMANLGFKQTTADLLRKIEVKFDGDPVRHYELMYQRGEFSKTLLAGIADFDADGNKFTEHIFEYYNDVRSGDQFQPLSQGTAWTVPGDGITGNFKTDVDGFGDFATALSGTRSKDRNIGVTVSVGIGVMVWSKQASAGVSGGYSKSETEGLLVMIDMNGDGLQDKVYVKNNQLHYRPNLANQESHGFAIKDIPIHGAAADAFFREKSRTTSFGAEASFGIFAGYSRSNTTSKTTTYFADVNGDQLPDIVKNGVVYFNHLDPDTGEIEYVDSSEGTPNPIFSSGTMASDLYDRDVLEQERQLAIDQNPLLDIVRMWKAPYSGKVRVTAPVKLLQSGDPQRAEEPVDGVRVAIQLQNTPLWDDIIEANDDQPHDPTGIDELTVNRGDMLFFRVGSRDNGSYDSVLWNPMIEYLDKDEELLDPNGRLVYTFSAGDDYVVSSDQNVIPPINGTVKITGELDKPVTTDDLDLFIFKEDHERNIIDTVWHRAYRWDEKAVAFPDFNLHVTDQDSYTFKVVSSSNIDWNSFAWRPKLVYVSADNPDIDLSKFVIEVSPTPEYWLYVNALHNAEPFLVELDSAGQRDTVSVDPEIAFLPRVFFEPAYTGDITLTAKKLDTLLAKQVLRVEDGKIVSDSILSVPVVHGDKIFFEFHTRDAYLGQRLGLYDIAFSVQEQDTTLQAGLHTTMPRTADREDVIFGTLYRGWGHFGWNGNREKATQPINVGLLKLSEELKEKGKKEINVDSGEELQNEDVYDAKKDPFFLLVASAADQHWISGDQNAWLSGEVIHSSRLGDDDLSIIEPGTGARGIDKVSKSKGNAYSLGAVAVGLTKSDADSHVLTDFMDMNGDRYPDIVSEKIIQYTNARGGLSDKVIPSLGFVQETEASTRAYSLSGSFPMPMPKFRTGIKTFKQSQVDGGDAASLSGSVSVNVSAATGENEANYSWLDINGDGLPDRVNLADGKVMLNLGYGFTAPETWNFGQIQKGESHTETGGLGLGVTKGNGSISVGFSLARSDNASNEMLMDINGDGLPDKVRKGNPVEVWINTGNGFAITPLEWYGATAISENATASESANAAFTIGFTLLGVKWTVTPSVSGGNAMSRDLSRFTDMNGDGYPDFVTSEAESDLNVSLSAIGRTNMLKTVHRPLGASFTMDYVRVGNTYEMPHSQWVLDRVEVFDGYAGDGVDSLLTTFAYENGYHDRFERDFFGFEKVITRSHDTEKDGAPVYTQVTQTFNNSDYFMKGLLLGEVMTDGEGNKFVAKANAFKLKDVREGVKYPCLETTRQEFFEGQPDPGKTTETHFVYDSLGNVVTFTDKGDIDVDEDDLVADITYHNVEDLYLKGSPESITVNGDGRVYRKRESEIDASGNVIRIRQYLDESNAAVYDLAYDTYGNLTKITRPENSNGERLSFEYQYDTEVQTYTTKVSNSYGYSSEAAYDFRFGQVLTTKDLNGNDIVYELDPLGRVINITGPYEKGGANKTIRFEYHPGGDTPFAVTRHFDPANPKNTLNTVIFVDGLGRVLQTKKDVAIFDGEGKPDVEMMTVSGRVLFDAFGRTTTAHYPTLAPADLNSLGEFIEDFDAIDPTRTTYDVLNRALSVTLPDDAVTTTEYGFGNDRDGKLQFRTKTTDANGKQTEQFTDVRGRVTAVKNYTAEKDVWTSFKYNAINEQVEATNDLGHTTLSQYDNFGRRVQRIHPDAGTTTYRYDLAGNLVELVTANLAKEGMAITYMYDHERLVEIVYPQNAENNVKYTYGEAGATDNRAGRIVLQEDASGAQEFFYGPLGEVVKNIRTIVIPQFDEQTYVTEWEYDTWNRLVSMVYPDGEKVTYTYNVGGLLRSMDGRKKSATFSYVKQLGYDKFEQRVFLAYGNGTKTTYTYEPERRRLETMKAQTAGKRLFMDNVYTYDKVNNILSLENKAPVPASNLMGGSSHYVYEYDDLYRLTSAEGTYQGSNEEHSYTLSMAYNSVGGITQKDQVHLSKGQQQKKTTYSMAYAYGETQPNAPVQIGDQKYTYDANGNQTGWTSDLSGQRRDIMWDEENRIRAISDNGAIYHYVYDASGERVLKGKSIGQRIFVNGEWKAGSGSMGNYSVYVNPYIVLKSGGYTKHYYIEGQRIVSKLGGGLDGNGKGPLKAGGNKVDYVSKGQRIFDAIVKNLKFLGADGQILTAGKSGKVPPGQVKGTGNTTEAFRYFYHPDHLGSTSYVTDASGEVYQHLEYFAFGETFVEEHSNSDRIPYLFNGKELDEETGLYYYGARYYDARVSVWLSVDPLMDKYPSISPFAFVYNNPLTLVDPEGAEPTPAEAAAMSAHVYGDKSNRILIGGWRVSTRDFGIAKNTQSGLKSQIYERENVNGAVEYVYATAGTQDSKDVLHDGLQTLGVSRQYSESMKNASAISAQLGEGTELTFTGHSLGGGEAAANAYQTGRNAITFNAAGVSSRTIAENPRSIVDAYVMVTDPLNIFQSTTDVPSANGRINLVFPQDNSSIYNGHSMDNMLKSFDIDPSKFKLKYDLIYRTSGVDGFQLPPIPVPNYEL